MIRFTKMKINNFRKHEILELVFNSGITLIRGKNGAGKSSIFEALLWILFNDTVRGDPIENVMRFGASVVSGFVYFTDTETNSNYIITRIRRKKGSNEVIISKDGKEQKFTNTNKANKRIEEILGVNKSLFKRIVYLDQYGTDYFTSETDAEKKEFLENLIDIEFFDNMEIFYKDKISDAGLKKQEIERLLSSVELDISVVNQKIEYLQDELDYMNKHKFSSDMLKDLEEERSKAIKTKDEIIPKIEEKAKEIEKIEKELSKIEVLDNTKLPMSEAEYERKKELLKKRKCMYCGQNISEELAEKMKHKLERYEEIIQKRIERDEKIKRKQKEYNEKLDNLKHEHFALFSKKEELIEKIEFLDEKIKEVKKDVERQTKRKREIEEEFKENKQFLEKLESKRKTGEKFIEKSEFVLAFLGFLKDVFSKKGIRSVFFVRYIKKLEENVNRILKTLLPDTEVLIDVELKESKFGLKRILHLKFNRENNELNYFSFSGGERKRIDIAFILAMQRLAERIGRFSCNVLIFDEIFDGLDEEGMQTVKTFLETYAKETIFIISHSNYIFDIPNVISL